MLRILSDLNTTFRVSVPVDSSAETNYAQGIWVTMDGKLPTSSAINPVGPIFDMGDATNDLSPDTKLVAGVGSPIKSTYGGSGTVTVIGGKFRGVTDQFAGTFGDLVAGVTLGIGADGKIMKLATIGSTNVVIGKVVTQHTDYEHRGTVHTQVVEFITE